MSKLQGLVQPEGLGKFKKSPHWVYILVVIGISLREEMPGFTTVMGSDPSFHQFVRTGF
jgi:hypothetical protein